MENLAKSPPFSGEFGRKFSRIATILTENLVKNLAEAKFTGVETIRIENFQSHFLLNNELDSAKILQKGFY